MKSNLIIGRKAEIEKLDAALREEEAQLIVVSGRRRIGKTFLINEYFGDSFAFRIAGANGKPKSFQLGVFYEEYLARSGRPRAKRPNAWSEAFSLLRGYIDSLPGESKKVVFFDEMPWLDTKKSDFLACFESFWNGYGNAKHNLVFICCGSSAAWMSDKFDKNKGGLFGRKTLRLKLDAWNLGDCERLLERKGARWSRYDVAQAYMVFGGVPYYFQKIDASLTLNQNMDRLFFDKGAELRDEFDLVLATLFGDDPKSKAILAALSDSKKGLTMDEIAGRAQMEKGGSLSKKLKRLVLSKFVEEAPYFNGRRATVYRLCDNFTRFHFSFIQGRREQSGFWSASSRSPSVAAWQGIAYESVCFAHIPQIKRALGIFGVLTEEYEFNVQGGDDAPGAQIDMVMERADGVADIIEIKFCKEEFVLDKRGFLNFSNKISVYERYQRRKKTIQTCFVTTFGLREGQYTRMISQSIDLDDLFQ